MDLASAGPLEVKFIITLRRSTPVIEHRRFELGPPGESKISTFWVDSRSRTFFLAEKEVRLLTKILINLEYA